MTLSDLKRPGTPLRDVEPLFAGMPLKEWQEKVQRSVVEAYAETPQWKRLRAAQKWERKNESK